MTPETDQEVTLSVVVPVYSGEHFLPGLVEALADLNEALASDEATPLRLLEAIFVLDDPKDGSRSVLEALEADYPWIRLIELSRNFGQHAATVAGILHSSGDWVATLDEDLQHPPSALPAIVAHGAREHADVVYATPKSGTHQSLYRDFASRSMKRLIGWLSGSRLVPIFSSFRLLRGQVARAAGSVCSNETYFDMTLDWFTERVVSLPLPLSDPRAGKNQKSGYTFFSLLRHAKRMLFSSDIRFFRLATLVSACSFLVSLLLLGWVFLSYFASPNDVTTEGWASLMSVNLFFGGVLAMLLGLVLEFVRTGLFHGQGKPAFFVVDRSKDAPLRQAADALKQITQRLEQATKPTNDG
jgi:glycosyltransferase involved in cell wall biosynthesis